MLKHVSLISQAQSAPHITTITPMFSSFMSHPYILSFRRHSSCAMSTDSYLGHWLFTALKSHLWAAMNWHNFVPTCHLRPLMSTSLPSIVSPRLYQMSATCPTHMRRDQSLSVNNGTQEQEKRKWNKDHTDALWLVETRFWRPYAVFC